MFCFNFHDQYYLQSAGTSANSAATAPFDLDNTGVRLDDEETKGAPRSRKSSDNSDANSGNSANSVGFDFNDIEGTWLKSSCPCFQ